MTLLIPTFVSVLGLALASITLVFSIIRWLIDIKAKKQLASVQVALGLEGFARACYLRVQDRGTWYPQDSTQPDRSVLNEPILTSPATPDFSGIENVTFVGLKHLDQILALPMIHESIQRSFNSKFEHDDPDFPTFFAYRQLYYAGLGLHAITLSRAIRKSVGSQGFKILTDRMFSGLEKRLLKAVTEDAALFDEGRDLKKEFSHAFLNMTQVKLPLSTLSED